MEETYKRNENCIVGLPRCDYVFNSNRSCFIAYGFKASSLEMEILKGILKENNIEVHEAGGELEPGKNAFCTKICSKIITSQFCLVLLNMDDKEGVKMPNANVNMEYGLMLGFNKYIIPFQRESESLPFNVSGLDTIKYNQSNFKTKAEKAIKRAIEQTKPKPQENLPPDRIIERFLMVNDAFMVPLDDVGNKNVYDLGSPFGYYLLNDFTGLKYYYLGIFNMLDLDKIKWRLNKLQQVLKARFSEDALLQKIELGITDENGVMAALRLLENMEGWIVVQTDDDKRTIEDFCKNLDFPFSIFSLSEINQKVIDEGI